jgi:amino acid adenylation domain-containing protein
MAFSKEEIEQSIPARFEQQVARYPDRLAVKTGHHQLTYAVLNQVANRIARAILAQHGEGEEPIALLFEHGAPMLTAILGVLKAGKFYVPLDPSLPRTRTLYILQDSQVSLIVTNTKNFSFAKELTHGALELLNIDELDTGLSTENVGLTISSNTFTWLLYTSGSTGQPKGVVQNHRNVLHFIMNYTNGLHLCPDDRLTLLFSYSANAGAHDIFSALLTGASLYPFDIKTEGLTRLASWLLEQEITIYCSVPTAFRHFLDTLTGAEQFPRLRLIKLVGEPVSKRDVERYKKCFPQSCLFVNRLGSTETGTIRWHFINKESQIHNNVVPVGYPVEDNEILLLDAAGNEVGVNEVGEIAVKSRYLSPGYWRKPDRTAVAFLPDPEGGDERIYLTGDLGRLLPDGCLEYLGRRDFQVKIRGHRIEMAEVEMALLNLAAIAAAVVMPREDRPGDQRLVAYFVPHKYPTPTVTALRRALAETLPDYMIPSTFVALEALPLAPNGKIDRRALPAPNQARPELEVPFLAPQTPLEEQLAAIWAEVLNLDRVGIHDNFLELGGDSLLATQIIARVHTVLRVEMSASDFFETPTIVGLAQVIKKDKMSDIARRIANLSPEKRALLEQRLLKEKATVVASPSIPRRGEITPCPLSFAQQRLWFLDQFEPASPLYNISQVVRLHGLLNVNALQKTLDALVARHEALRTTFAVVDGTPVQVIALSRKVELAVHNLREELMEEREAVLHRVLTEETQRPFDLTRDVMLRATVFHLAEQEHVLLLVMHHIASDGWSMGIFFRELTVCYTAFVNGQSLSLPPLPIQYADYAVWQRQWLQGEELAKQVAYWRRQLAGMPSLLELPTDYPRPAVQTYHGTRYHFLFTRSLANSLTALSRQEGVTLFMLLLAAFQVLLQRYTRQEDIVVGSPIAGRTRAETEGLIGFFVNTLVLRTDCAGNPTFRELLRRVREVALEAYAHQDLPFERLVEEVQPERTLSYSPLCQVIFALQNAPSHALELAGLTISPVEIDTGTAKFDLSLFLREEEDGLRGTLEYNTDLFEAATVRRMREHYQTLLAGIVANPDERIATLPLLTAIERQQLLVEWNTTQTASPRAACIQQLFEAQVARTPEAVAVVYGEQHLTYHELNCRANQLAHYLRTLGVGPEVLVGLCVERSLEMIVGVLGTLKAGGAYVPLDPTYPQERLAFMLTDTQAPVLLTQAGVVERLPKHGARVVCLDTGWARIAQEETMNPLCQTTADSLAYVIYTSGSTGTPKGTCIPHRGVVRLVKHTNYLPFNAKEVFLQFAPLSFDASTFEIWGSLLNGARLVLFPAYAPSLEELGQFAHQHGITTLWLTAPLFHQMVDNQLEKLQGIRYLLAGGDVLSVSHVQQALTALPSCRLINGYGPTENTTFTCCYSITEPRQCEPTVPIGRPIANTQVYILDAHLQPVPIGVPGEIYIGGDGLARGYLNRPELTAERFLLHPFSPTSGARLYRTGDLARYRPDGNIEFLGRLDHQVKLRGFRVELGEIEAVFTQHPAVREVVVVVREDTPGDKRLVAYVVSAQAQFPTISELRSFLQGKLPEYMVPALFVFLKALPLTPNGKVDRRALPRPDSTRPELETGYVTPQTPIEETVAGIWAEVLKVERVGIHDNFFALGGHSLLATQVISRIRTICQVDLPLRSLFEKPTVAGLSAVIMQTRANSSAQPVPGILPVSRQAYRRSMFLPDATSVSKMKES